MMKVVAALGEFQVGCKTTKTDPEDVVQLQSFNGCEVVLLVADHVLKELRCSHHVVVLEQAKRGITQEDAQSNFMFETTDETVGRQTA